MKVIAHRGALKEALENSWSAFEKAVEAKSDRIEFDVVLSKDQHPLIMHDVDLLRCTGVDKHADDLTRAEIEKIPLINKEKIPFLDEMCDRFLDKVEFNIEIKGNSGLDAEKVAEIVLKYPTRLDKIIVSSFNPEPLVYLSENYPDIQIACLHGPVQRWPRVACFSPLVFMQWTGAKIIHPWVKWVDRPFMDQAKSRGWKVFTWCEVKSEEDTHADAMWAGLYNLQVDGHCSNYPREFRQWLGKNNLL